MSHTPRIWRPETRPQDCWDWVTPEDVCRHALAAFYLAREAVKQPPGRRFAEPDGTCWSDRETFGDNLAAVFELRIKTDGYHLGIAPDWAADAKQLQLWAKPRSWFPDELQHPEHQQFSRGMGGTPMVTGPDLTASTPSANPAGLAPDAGNGAKLTPNRPCAP